MHPYKTKKLTECPDVGEIQAEARQTICGRLERGSKTTRFVDNIVEYADGTTGRTIVKTVHNDHGYIRNAETKKKIRRNLKRADKAKQEEEDESC